MPATVRRERGQSQTLKVLQSEVPASFVAHNAGFYANIATKGAGMKTEITEQAILLKIEQSLHPDRQEILRLGQVVHNLQTQIGAVSLLLEVLMQNHHNPQAISKDFHHVLERLEHHNPHDSQILQNLREKLTGFFAIRRAVAQGPNQKND